MELFLSEINVVVIIIIDGLSEMQENFIADGKICIAILDMRTLILLIQKRTMLIGIKKKLYICNRIKNQKKSNNKQNKHESEVIPMRMRLFFKIERSSSVFFAP